MHSAEITNLIQQIGRLPSLGPRSARRIVLHLLAQKETVLSRLLDALAEAHKNVSTCIQCGNLDTSSPCSLCTDTRRDQGIICVVESVSDLWAIERSKTYRGLYHVLGGLLSAMDGVGPSALNLAGLHRRIPNAVHEVVLSLSATVDGQTTLHYVNNQISAYPNVKITTLAHGVPVGGELDYLDDGTLTAAFSARRLVA